MAGAANRKILCYSGTSEYSERDILIISSEDEDVVRLYLSAKKPFKCFVASGENIANHEPVLKYYIKYEHAPSSTNVSFDGNSAHFVFFSDWEKLVEDFNAMQPRLVLGDVRRLRNHRPTFFLKIDSLLNVVEQFSLHVTTKCLEGTPFFGRESSQMPRRWTTISVNWIVSLRSVEETIQKAQKNLVIAVPLFTLFQDFIQKQLKAWQDFEKMDSRAKCFEFSAYAFGLAEFFGEIGQHGNSLLLAHRALDFYFIFLGLKFGTLVETVDGFRYVDLASQEMAVNVLQSFKELDKGRALASGLGAAQAVRDLNDARNMLLLTHNVYGSESAVVKALRKRTETLIHSIEGLTDNRWTQARGKWFPLPRLEMNCLFELEPSMNSYIGEAVL
jgi:hypothetical protein